MPAMLAQYTVVRVTAVRDQRFNGQPAYEVRHPRVGDVGTILEVYETPGPAYEVESSDPATGETVWLAAMFPDQVEALS